MPYISIKTFPKDEATKKAAVDKINEVLLELWGCPQEAITISIEEFIQEDYKEQVQPEIQSKMDKMYMLKGEKKY